jgi:two-component SAPR family response regulator
MISTLLISRKKSLFSDVKNVLVESLIKTAWSRTGTKALSMLSKKPVDLLIIEENLFDMTGKKFIKNVVMKNPMTNCVVASPLSPKEFHDTYEGLGVLMQLPVFPEKKDAQKLIKHLKLIFHLQVTQ